MDDWQFFSLCDAFLRGCRASANRNNAARSLYSIGIWTIVDELFCEVNFLWRYYWSRKQTKQFLISFTGSAKRWIRRIVTHKSTVARTVTCMCRQDGRGRFPVLLDDLSKCRTNSQRKSQLSWNFLYDIYIEWYIQTVQQITRTLIHKNQFTSLCRGQKPASKCIRLVYEILVICRVLQALYTPQRCELMKKNNT